MSDNDLEEFEDFDPEINPEDMPTFDIPNLAVDLMAHVSALEKLLVWSGIITPDCLNAVVIQCRFDFDQQLADMRNRALEERFTPAQIRAWWKVRDKMDGLA